MQKVIYGYVHTLTSKKKIKNKTLNCLNSNVVLEKFAKFGGQCLEFIRKKVLGLLNVENYQKMKYTKNNI